MAAHASLHQKARAQAARRCTQRSCQAGQQSAVCGHGPTPAPYFRTRRSRPSARTVRACPRSRAWRAAAAERRRRASPPARTRRAWRSGPRGSTCGTCIAVQALRYSLCMLHPAHWAWRCGPYSRRPAGTASSKRAEQRAPAGNAIGHTGMNGTGLLQARAVAAAGSRLPVTCQDMHVEACMLNGQAALACRSLGGAPLDALDDWAAAMQALDVKAAVRLDAPEEDRVALVGPHR